MSLSGEVALGMTAGMRRRVELARMEADVAYFQARLELIGEPTTSNQMAQRRVFKNLCQHLSREAAERREASSGTTAFSVEGLFES